MRNEILLRMTGLAANIPVARMAVATFASSLDFTISGIEEIKVAVSEAVSNAVLHAYPQGEGEILVRAFAEGDNLVIEVEDNGQGISDIPRAKEAGFTTMPDHMGLGLCFIESFVDEVYIDSSPSKGTKVRMVKKACP